MGKVADILTSPEWTAKPALEKAQARRELFSISLTENPNLRTQFDAADEPGKQKLVDSWKQQVEAKFPEAFTTDGHRIELSPDGKRTVNKARTPVYDVATEQVLSRAEPFAKRGGGLDQWNKDGQLLAQLPDDARKAVTPFIWERYGDADLKDETGKDIFGKPEDFIQKEESMGKRIFQFAVPMALRAAPPLVASVTRNPRIVAMAAAGGDAAAQATEQMMGTRQSFSPTELGLNTVLSMIPAAVVKNFANPALNLGARAAVRAAEGAAQGAIFEGVRQVVDEGEMDAGRIGMAAGFGAGLGALVGGFEPKIAAMLAGKRADAALDTIKAAVAKAPEGERAALLNAQRQIEESLGIGAPAKNAADSALALSAENPPVVNVARESAEVLASGEFKSQRQLDMESALNEADALNKSPRGADGLRAGMTAEEAASRAGNRSGSTVTDSSIPVLEAGTAADPRIVTGPADPLGGRMTPPVEMNVGQSGRVRPAWDKPQADESGIIVPTYNRRPPDVPPSGTPEVASVTPPPPGVQPSESVAGRAKQGEVPAVLTADSASNQASPASVQPAIEGNPKQFSRREIAGQRRVIRDLEEKAKRLAQANPKRVPAVQAQIEKEQAALAGMMAAKRTGPALDVGMSPNGERDLLNDIADLGGIRGPNSVENPGDVYGGFAGAFGGGPARLLVRKGSGSTPDQLMGELAGIYRFNSPDEFYTAVSKAAETRAVLAKQLGDVEYGAKFDAALFENSGRKTHLNTSDPVNVDTLNVGDEFKIRGEPVKVADVDPDTGAVTVKDGVTREIPPGTEIFPDKGEVKKAAPADDFLSPEAGAIGGEAGFISPSLASSLAGGTVGFAAGAARDPEGATEQERTINRLKNGLVMGIAGAGGGYMLGRRFLSSGGVTPPRPGASVLRDVDKVLTPPAGPTLGQRLADAPGKVRAALFTRYAPLDKLADEVEKANNVSMPGLSMSRRFEQVAGAGGKAMADVRAFSRSILRPAKGNEGDLDRLLFLKRTGQRLEWNQRLASEKARIGAIPKAQRTPQEIELLAKPDDLKRVADWDLAKVDAGLAELEQAIGAKRFAELDQLAAGEFQQQLDRNLRLQVESGRISQEAYDAIKASNDFYAPFRVLQKLDDIEGGRIPAGIDTREQIAKAITGIDDQDFRLDSPTKAAMENIFNGRLLAEKNVKMLELAKLADIDQGGTVIRKLKDWQQPRKGYDTVNFFENGVPMRLEVLPEVAEAVKGLSAGQTKLAADFVSRGISATAQAGRTALRFGATGANVGFQAVNLLAADQPRLAMMSKYGVNAGDAGTLGIRYAADFVHALYSSVLGNVAGVDTALYRKFYESGAAGTTIQDAISPYTLERATGAGGVGRSIARNTIGRIEDLARAVEETTKIMGLKRAMRIEGIDKMSPAQASQKMEEIVAEIRNFSGSPDFARHGTAVEGLNLVFMFFNARLQGTAADFGRLAGSDGGKRAAISWVRLGAGVGIPAAGVWMLNQREENIEDRKKVPTWEAENYFMIPRYGADGKGLYSKNDEGVQVREYFRVPKREITKLFGNLVESSLDFAANEDPEAVARYAESFLENVSPINVTGNTGQQRMESVIGGMNPLLKIPYEVASGRDTFRHRPIVPKSMEAASPEQQFTDSTPQAYVAAADAMPQFVFDPMRSPLMLQQAVNSATGGALNQFTSSRTIEGRDPTAAAMGKNPVGRRFVGSLQVDREGDQRSIDDAKRASTDERLKLERQAQAILEGARKPGHDKAATVKMLRENPRLLDAVLDEADAQAKGLTPIDRQARALPVEDGTRARWVTERLKAMPPDKRSAELRRLAEKGILTERVLDQILAGGK